MFARWRGVRAVGVYLAGNIVPGESPTDLVRFIEFRAGVFESMGELDEIESKSMIMGAVIVFPALEIEKALGLGGTGGAGGAVEGEVLSIYCRIRASGST